MDSVHGPPNKPTLTSDHSRHQSYIPAVAQNQPFTTKAANDYEFKRKGRGIFSAKKKRKSSISRRRKRKVKPFNGKVGNIEAFEHT